MSLPKWFTPTRMLAIFTAMSLIVYLDRGLIASTGVNGVPATANSPGRGIQGDFVMSNFQNGCLPAAFMVGLMVAAPIFAEQSKHVNAFRLVGIGLGIWMVAVLFCAAAPNFGALIACRSLVGAGEASFVVLAAPFIDDYAPPALKSLWLAIFYMSIPVGYAAGYIYGGLVGYAFGWRAAFASEALLMLPFIIFAFRTRPIPLHKDSGAHDDEATLLEDGAPAAAAPRAAPSELVADLKILARRPVFVLAVLGNTTHTAVLGMYSYWGPRAITYMFGLHGSEADLMFGGLTVGTGILGTLAGGIWLDRLGATSSWNATVVCLVAIAGGAVTVQVAFALCYRLLPFMVLFAAGEFLLFMIQSPLTTLILLSVPTDLRPLAFSVQTISIHVFGDVPAPPAAAWIHDHVFQKDDSIYPQSWRSTVLSFNSLFAVGTAFFVAALLLMRRSRTGARRTASGAAPVTPATRGRRGPLSTVTEGLTPCSSSPAMSLLDDSYKLGDA